jgi:hypothetical protein
VGFRIQVCELLQGWPRTHPWDGTTWACDPKCDTGNTSALGSCVWDTGLVRSGSHVNIHYGPAVDAASAATAEPTVVAAAPLHNDTTYIWRVQWEARSTPEVEGVGEDTTGSNSPPVGELSGYSRVARMHTGFIGGTASFPEGQWIGVDPKQCAIFYWFAFLPAGCASDCIGPRSSCNPSVLFARMITMRVCTECARADSVEGGTLLPSHQHTIRAQVQHVGTARHHAAPHRVFAARGC